MSVSVEFTRFHIYFTNFWTPAYFY